MKPLMIPLIPRTEIVIKQSIYNKNDRSRGIKNETPDDTPDTPHLNSNKTIILLNK